jgi:hypothetical protein
VLPSLAIVAAACGGPAPTVAPSGGEPTAAAPVETKATTLAAPPALVQKLRRLGFLPLSLLLPDTEGWQSARDEARLYEAEHPASGSRIVAELLDGAFGTSVQCAHQQPRPPDAVRTLIDEGSVRAPLAIEVAYATFAEERHDHSVSGRVVAFAAFGGRCARLRIETRARGENAAAEVGARLAFFRDVSLPSLLVVRDGHAPSSVRTNLERR